MLGWGFTGNAIAEHGSALEGGPANLRGRHRVEPSHARLGPYRE